MFINFFILSSFSVEFFRLSNFLSCNVIASQSIVNSTLNFCSDDLIFVKTSHQIRTGTV